MKELLRKALVKVKKWKVGEKNIFKLFFSKSLLCIQQNSRKKRADKMKVEEKKTMGNYI